MKVAVLAPVPPQDNLSNRMAGLTAPALLKWLRLDPHAEPPLAGIGPLATYACHILF
jgi:hypothetical protein